MHEIIRFEHVSYTYEDGRQASPTCLQPFPAEKKSQFWEKTAQENLHFFCCAMVFCNQPTDKSF